MIRKLKRRFIALAMAALTALLTVVVLGMNLINYSAVVREADETLAVLSDNRGLFPKDMDMQPRGGGLPPRMSPETPFESRFFSVLLDADGQAVQVDTDNIAAVDEQAAGDYALAVAAGGRTRGFVQNYRYAIAQEGESTRVTFLDCGRSLDSFRRFLLISVCMSLLGLLIVFFVIVFYAGRIVRPIAESYEKQKRFITDAGHEIKTPLTIIGANAELLEMELGENESLADIRQQVTRLTSLTKDLSALARMEEGGEHLELTDIPISDVIQEAAGAFKAVAQGKNKQIALDVQQGLSMRADQRAMEQLLSILMDNAMKYSPEGAVVHVTLKKQGKALQLSVENPSLSPVDEKELSHVFERFYRTDKSRNSAVGGHGIGLSIASAITQAHGGRIWAFTKDGKSFGVTASFPQ